MTFIVVMMFIRPAGLVVLISRVEEEA